MVIMKSKLLQMLKVFLLYSTYMYMLFFATHKKKRKIVIKSMPSNFEKCKGIAMLYMSRLMGKPTICIGENKDADQLRGYDQRLCFRYSDSTIPLLSKSKISSLWLSSVLVQPGLCLTCSETTLLVFPRGGSIRTQYLPSQQG